MSRDLEQEEIILELAEDEDVAEIHGLMEEVHNCLEDKSLYVCDEIDFVKKHIKDEGFTVKAINHSGKIIGCFIFRYPGINQDNLGYDINLDVNELQKVLHLESSVVAPEYRGKGLQSRMLLFAEEYIDKNNYKYLMATISPDNPASYRSLEKNGYKLAITKEKYGGLIRRIYVKEIKSI